MVDFKNLEGRIFEVKTAGKHYKVCFNKHLGVYLSTSTLKVYNPYDVDITFLDGEEHTIKTQAFAEDLLDEDYIEIVENSERVM